MTAPAPTSIFDRALYTRRRAKSAAIFADHDFLHRRAMEDVVDRLETVTRSFPRALFYGAGPLSAMLTAPCGVGAIVHGDLAAERLEPGAASVVFDEEATPFAPQSFDLIVSLLTLHAANDPVGALAQMRAALKPDGLLIAVLFAEDTLRELREALYRCEAAFAGGVSPRVAPFANVRDLGAALQRAGFALPVADLDRARVRYKNPMRLLGDIRGMGEASCLSDRGRGMRRDALAAALDELSVKREVTFDLVTLTGWAPHESQQKPMKPGSAQRSLKKALDEF